MRHETAIGFFAFVLLTLLTGGVSRAQNVVVNPDFEIDLSGWSMNSGNNGGMLSLDSADGSPVSPSLSLQPGGTPAALVDSSCFLLDGSQNVDLHADIKRVAPVIPPPALTGVTLNVNAYGDTACSTLSGNFYVSYDDCTPTGAAGWNHCALVDHTLPAGTHSVRLSFAAQNSVPSANLDHVALGPTGTVPVTLQAFDIQ